MKGHLFVGDCPRQANVRGRLFGGHSVWRVHRKGKSEECGRTDTAYSIIALGIAPLC